AKKGEGDFLVAEADESDGSFMKLCPTIAVVTGLDHEHLDYYKTFETIQATFLDFINKIPFYGRAILCGDDPHLRALLPHVEKRVLTYGTEEGLDLIAEEIAFHEWKTMFRARLHGKTLGDFHLPAPGVHNVLNALAAIAVGLELEMPVSEIQKGVQSYQGVQRRFHLQGEQDGVLVVDDYAHHPTEIRATLQAAKQGWNAEVAVVFQPHRYTRTRDCLEALAESFQHADHLILSEIYPAGEKAIPGIDGQRLYQAVLNHRQRKTHFLQDRSDIVASLRKIAKPGMVILTLGAGDVWKVGEAFLKGAG
ncbi:MAG: UDP-N-acetylmuramate--L-alanine ligase, partial [Nitrospiria bacterium]